MTASVNGRDVLTATVREPRVGIWTGELDCDSEQPLTGKIELTIDGAVFRGTVVRGDVEQGHYHAWFVGGAYGLAKQIGPMHYMSASCGLVLRELLVACGELQAPTADKPTLAKRFARWSRAAGTAGSALAQLATDCNVSWRMLRDGTVWVGPETWPAAQVSYDELDYIPARGSLLIAPESPTVKPGETFDGGKVSLVTTTVTDEGTRQTIVYEDDNSVGGSDRVRQQLANTVESLVGRRLNLSNWYPARVVSQALDGTVDLLPDDTRMRGAGIARVPLRHGLPGCTVLVAPGSRVMLYFENNDAKQPAAGLWPDGSSVLQVELSASALLRLRAPTVQVMGNLVVSGSVAAASVGAPTITAGGLNLGTHVHPVPTPPGSFSGAPQGPPPPRREDDEHGDDVDDSD